MAETEDSKKHVEEHDGGKKEEKPEKKKKKEKGGDDENGEKKKKKEKNPEDMKDPGKLKAKLEKIESKIQALVAKKDEILKLLQAAEANPAGKPSA